MIAMKFGMPVVSVDVRRMESKHTLKVICTGFNAQDVIAPFHLPAKTTCSSALETLMKKLKSAARASLHSWTEVAVLF